MNLPEWVIPEGVDRAALLDEVQGALSHLAAQLGLRNPRSICLCIYSRRMGCKNLASVLGATLGDGPPLLEDVVRLPHCVWQPYLDRVSQMVALRTEWLKQLERLLQ